MTDPKSSEHRSTERASSERADEFEAGPDDLAERLANVDEELAHQRATALRAGLADYDLDDADLDVLEAVTENPDEIQYLPALPVVAIVRLTTSLPRTPLSAVLVLSSWAIVFWS